MARLESDFRGSVTLEDRRFYLLRLRLQRQSWSAIFKGLFTGRTLKNTGRYQSVGAYAVNIKELRRLSIEQWEALCRYLLPAGHKEGYRWLVGSISGEQGRSFDGHSGPGFGATGPAAVKCGADRSISGWR